MCVGVCVLFVIVRIGIEGIERIWRVFESVVMKNDGVFVKLC